MEYIIQYISPLVLGLFSIAWIVRIFYTLRYYAAPYRKLISRTSPPQNPEIQSVSVIVIALNRETGFIRNIKKILAQRYPRFEVIVIIDNADKDVEDQLKLLMHEDDRLRYTFIPHEAKNISKRKLALTIALKSARYEWILQTESYCRPASDEWITKMMNARTEQSRIVLGGNISEKLPIGIRRSMSYINLLQNLQILSCGILKIPYTGEATNLLVEKELLIRHIHFGKTLKEEMGEDRILINSVANKTNVAVELSTDTVTIAGQLDKKDWKKKQNSLKKCRQEMKGPGKKLWELDKTTLYVYYILLVITLIIQYPSIIHLTITLALHLTYRLTFWTILFAYSQKTKAQPFYILPFCSWIVYPLLRTKPAKKHNNF